nr:hypothetical protein [uncultured Oscillibacter sp.]
MIAEDKRPNRLSIETDLKTSESKVEVAGTIPNLIFNLTVLTSAVCDEVGISPQAWAFMVPDFIKTYKGTVLNGKITANIGALREILKRRGGGTP